jgi:hypothetical protein
MEDYDGTNWTTSPATLASRSSLWQVLEQSTAAVAAGGTCTATSQQQPKNTTRTLMH